MCGTQAPPLALHCWHLWCCCRTCAWQPCCMTLIDDTQRKGACDWVSDDRPRSLWYWLTSTYVEAHQSGDIVELIILKLKQLPWVTLVETNMYKLTQFLYAIIWINQFPNPGPCFSYIQHTWSTPGYRRGFLLYPRRSGVSKSTRESLKVILKCISYFW